MTLSSIIKFKGIEKQCKVRNTEIFMLDTQKLDKEVSKDCVPVRLNP